MRKKEWTGQKPETPYKRLHVKHDRRGGWLEATIQKDFCAMLKILNFILRERTVAFHLFSWTGMRFACKKSVNEG